MIYASPAPAIAALIVRARRQIAGHFFVHHAVSPEDAVAFVPKRRIVRHQFEKMQARGVIRQAAPGTYWIDTAAYQAESDRRRRIMVPVVIAILLVLAAIPLFFYKKGAEGGFLSEAASTSPQR